MSVELPIDDVVPPKRGWIDDRFPPEMQLFFSVDIEGSTRFKQSPIHGRSAWGPFFLEFFETFPGTLASCEDQLGRLIEHGKAARFKPWKSLGDELIFSKKLITGYDVFIALCAARTAIIKGSAKLRAHRDARLDSGDTDRYPVHLKGTVWVAGFPIKNMKVTSSQSGMGEDFLGPAMDLGFRLTKESSPSRMTVSTTAAWMAAKVEYDNAPDLAGQTLKWSYSGRQPLKGIDEHPAGYPVLCVDVSESTTGTSRQEQNLLRRSSVSPADVVEFCEQQFKSAQNPAGKHGRPFILDDVIRDFDLPDDQSIESEDYRSRYKEFLTTQPVVTPLMDGTDVDGQSAQVISAIDAAAAVLSASADELASASKP